MRDSIGSIYPLVIVLSFITISFLPLIFRLIDVSYNNDLRFPLTSSGWIVFIFIGYYISHYEISFKRRLIIYLFGFLGLLTFIVGTIIWSFSKHTFINYFEEYGNVPCVLYSSALFLLFKNLNFESKAGNVVYKIAEFIAPTTLGIYIIHMLVKDEIIMIWWNKTGFGWNTLLVFLIFIPSFMIVKLLKLVPHSNYLFP